MATRKRISDAVTNRLFALSGNECALPGCSNKLTAHEGDERPVTVGERAHLAGVGRQGPRSEAAGQLTDIDAVENLILLCHECHKRVDENPRIYSVEVLAKHKLDHEAKIARRAPEPTVELRDEAVDVSILPLTAMPEHIYVAPTKYRTTVEVAERLPRPRRRDEVLAFVLSAGQVWAFHDLRDPRGPFGRAVDVAAAEARTIEDVAVDRPTMYVWLLNAMLRSALRRRGVGHDKEHDRYYFLADHETITRRVVAKSKLGRAQNQKKVVRQEGERSGNLRNVWWHLAASLRFEEFAPGQWGLTLRPEYHLTSDGSTPLDPRRIGRKVTSRKSRMYNEAYFDAVHFLRYFLMDGRKQMVLRAGAQTLAVGADFPQVQAYWVAIDDKTFEPAELVTEADEDDVLDAVVSEIDYQDDWDWGAEPSEAEQ
jgi:hypothetical protein